MCALPPDVEESAVNDRQPEIHPLVRKLESISPLSGEESAALRDLPMQVHDLRADQDIVREGDQPSRSCLLLEGFACRFKTTSEGKRQIFSFHMAGEIPDLQSLHLKTMDHSLQTNTPCKVGFITHKDLRVLCERHPNLCAALWRETLIDAAIFREWMLGLGQKEATPRMARFFCEMLVRLQAIGLADGDECPLPLTQGELGEALGITTVHVNRTLMELREARLIEFKGGILAVKDWVALKTLGDFDATYLHQQNRRAP